MGGGREEKPCGRREGSFLGGREREVIRRRREGSILGRGRGREAKPCGRREGSILGGGREEKPCGRREGGHSEEERGRLFQNRKKKQSPLCLPQGQWFSAFITIH